MKKITNILLALLINIASLSTCYADWQDDLWEALKQGKTTLDLSHQNIDNAGVKIIAEALAASDCKITKLDLSDNQIDDEGVKLIIETLAAPGYKLTEFELNLNNNKLTPDGAQLVEKTFASPSPKLTIAPANEIIQALAKKYKDLVKANVRQKPQILEPTDNKFTKQLVDGVLYLKGQALSPEDVDKICALKSIKKLTLINCWLQQVPPFPRDYPASIINLTNNKFDHRSEAYEIRLKNLFLLPNLRNLNLSNCGITSILNLSPEERKNCQIMTLSIAKNDLFPCVVQMLTQLPLLEVADFGSCKLKHAPNFASNRLTMLKLDNNNFKNSNELRRFFEHPTLEKLILDFCNITCIKFDPEQCHLKQLSLRGNKLDQKTIARLGSSITIEELVLQECGLEYDKAQAFVLAIHKMQQLKQSIKLYKLNLSFNNLENANLEPILNLKSLRVLSLSTCSITSLKEFDPTKSQLENLNIARNPIDHDSLMKLTQIPNLTQLEIHGYDMLVEMVETAELNNELKPNYAIIKALMQMPKLEILNVNGCANLNSLGDFEPKTSNIRQLWVAGNQLDDASYAKIAQMPNLTKLNIRKCNTSQKNLAQVFGIENLEYFEVGELEFEDNRLNKGGNNIKEVFLGYPPEYLNYQNTPNLIAEFSWLPNLTNLNNQYYEHTDQMKMARRVDNCELYVMSTKPTLEFVVRLLKYSPSVVYIVVDDTIYAIKNVTLKQIGQGAWLKDMIKNTESNSAIPVRLSAEEKAIITANTGYRAPLNECELYVKSSEPSDGFAVNLLKDHPNATYVVFKNENKDEETIYAIENITCNQINSGDWLKAITKNIPPNNNNNIPLRLSAEQKAIITANTGYRAPYAYQQQREEFYHDFNRLKKERVENDQNEQKLEQIKSVAAIVENMMKNTLQMFESGSQ